MSFRIRCGWVMSALLVTASAGLNAHDMWIEPTTFEPQLGHVLGLKLRVGDNFHGDPIPRTAAMIERFIVADAHGIRDVVGREGADPAGLLRVTADGEMVAGYQSSPNPVTLTGARFTAYLKEEALDGILALRAARGHTARDAREVFVRCAKTVVDTGAARGNAWARRLGFTLELVPEANPTRLSVGEDLTVGLWYQGRPLPGVRVLAVNQRSPFDRVSATSDAGGHVRLPLPMTGTWLVKAVHMVPAPSGSTAEWASYWASLTFEMRGAER